MGASLLALAKSIYYSSLPLMFPTHNPYYGRKQLNQNSGVEKG